VNQAFVRVYADCKDDVEASTLARAFELALWLYEPVPTAAPARYCKLPELYGFTYQLSSPTRDIWSELVSETDGWLLMVDEHERSAVWNRVADRKFLVAEAAWAEVQVIASQRHKL
jgi:hypothetical protein